MHYFFMILWPHSLPHTPSSHVLLMSNSKHLTHDISNLVSLITKTKLGLSIARLDAAPRCAVDRRNDPLKSPRPFLIKKRSLLLSARLAPPRSSARPPDCRSYLPVPGPVRGRLRVVTLVHRTAGLACQVRRVDVSEPWLPSVSLPCCVADASLPPRAAAASGELHTSTSLHSLKQQRDVETCWKRMLQAYVSCVS
jgi:hypothetical protein